MSDELCRLTLHRMGEAIRRRELSPVELTAAHLERIERLDGHWNAFLTVMSDEAHAAAQRAEADVLMGDWRGLLHGVPVSLKDLFWTAGTVTTAGSKILADFVPTEDATVVARLRAAGAVIIGKTNLHEFAFGATSVNPHFGPVRNPWDPSRVAGGSSGGSAAAVAGRLSALSLGTDTAGSIRIPAALCGVVGFKPTYGAVSRFGVVPLAWSLDHVGPLTRSVEDAAIATNVIAGHDRRDGASSRRATPDFCADLGKGIRGLRVGLLREFFTAPTESEVRDRVLSAVEVLASAGMEVSELSVPEAVLAPAVRSLVAFPEASAYHERWLATRLADYGADVRRRLQLGKLILASEYLHAQRVRTAIGARFIQAMAGVDVLATPTVPIPAPPIDEVATETDKEAVVRDQLTSFTQVFNYVGWPTISVPCGFTAGGLPLGLQISGRPWEDTLVLRVASAYEASTGWHRREPVEPESAAEVKP